MLIMLPAYVKLNTRASMGIVNMFTLELEAMVDCPALRIPWDWSRFIDIVYVVVASVSTLVFIQIFRYIYITLLTLVAILIFIARYIEYLFFGEGCPLQYKTHPLSKVIKYGVSCSQTC